MFALSTDIMKEFQLAGDFFPKPLEIQIRDATPVVSFLQQLYRLLHYQWWIQRSPFSSQSFCENETIFL